MKHERQPNSENWDSFVERLKHFTEQDRFTILDAYNKSKYAHKYDHQARVSGERKFEHPRNVALILLDELKWEDAAAICGALLHETKEDTAIFGNPKKMNPEEYEKFSNAIISDNYYPDTAEIVTSLTEPFIDGEVVKDKHDAKEVKWQRLQNASAKALVIKLADRLNSLRDFFIKEGELTPNERISETLEYVIPVCERASIKYPKETEYLISEIYLAIDKLKTRAAAIAFN